MAARYLVRFDDIAPGLNWRVWLDVERVLTAEGIKPILAVVPDNQHPLLDVAPRVENFWEHVRSWQGRGWTIGVHGFQHRYETTDAGIIGLNHNSEFAGVAARAQEAKLRAALAIFAAECVQPDVWIAPAHSFDDATLDILRDVNLRRINDGFFLYPHVDERRLLWVPQQLWRFRRRPFGIWTVCYHINTWTDDDLARFARDVREFAGAITDFEGVCAEYGSRRASAVDSLVAFGYLRYLRMLRRVASLRKR